MNIGKRYTKQHVLKRATTDYEELNAPVSSHEFNIQSALIGAPLDVRNTQTRSKDVLLYTAALIVGVGSFVLSLS